MSNNSTFVPGMQEAPSKGFNPYAKNSAEMGMGTFVPGMAAPTSQPPQSSGEEQKHGSSGVVGFLYSISNNGIREYWPLYLGANTIGRASDTSVKLSEASVSDHHAQINIKQMRTSRKLIASIQDTGSKNGIFVNDEELEYEAHPCKNGDLITIGNAYNLLLILVDPDAHSMTPSENFIPVEQVEEEDDFPTFNTSSANNHGGNYNNATISLNGDSPMAGPGGTMILEGDAKR